MPFKDSKEGETHYFGDGCIPPHKCPEGTCVKAYDGVCKKCNQRESRCMPSKSIVLASNPPQHKCVRQGCYNTWPIAEIAPICKGGSISK